MAICIFPGTFNPIHQGHLKMAQYALQKYKFDKIIFIPAGTPPHKNLDTNLAKHRLNMVRLAVNNNPKFEVSDIEYNMNGKSYSLLTVRKIIEIFSLSEKVNFIIGTDAFVKLNSWYKAEELKNLVHFIVFPRRGDGDTDIYNMFRKNGWDFEVTDMEYIDISSTDIRNLTLNNDGIRQVEEYIKQNGLYKI